MSDRVHQYFVEFPTDQVVDVHWQGHHEPTEPGQGTDTTDCGGRYNRHGAAGYGLIITDSSVYLLTNPPLPYGTSIKDLPPGTTYGSPVVPWYLWNAPGGGFSAEIRPQIQYG